VIGVMILILAIGVTVADWSMMRLMRRILGAGIPLSTSYKL
jgi:hypothetical protein